MATKEITVIRYTPPNPLIGRRELSVMDLKREGIFTQKKPLLWDKTTGFWIDAEAAEVSDETRRWLQDPKNWVFGEKWEFETQTVEVDDSGEELPKGPQEINGMIVAPEKPAAEAEAPEGDKDKAEVDGGDGVEGSQATGSPASSSTANSTTTTSRAKAK